MRFEFVGSHIKVNLKTLEAFLKVGVAFTAEEDKDESFPVQHIKKHVIPEGGYPGQTRVVPFETWDKIEENGEKLYILRIPDEGYLVPADMDNYRAWFASLPTVWVTNPTFTHWLLTNPNTTLPQLEQEIQRVFTPDVLTSADRFLAERGKLEREGFSKYRKMMAARERLGNGLVLPKGYNARGLITAANNKFRGLGGELDGKGEVLHIPPDTITVGADATDRELAVGISLYTRIGKENPANADGEITSCEIWLSSKSDVADVWVGTFSASGDVLTVRDSESIGDIATGSKQTASGLEITVETGDYFGCFDKNDATVRIEFDLSGAGVWEYHGECIDATDSQTFTLSLDRTMSLYGEGEPPTPGYQDILTRFRLRVQGFTDIATRFDLVVTKDILTRFSLSLGVQAYEDVATRFKLGVQAYRDTATRFKLIVQNYKDAPTRFQLVVTKDVATRFKLTVQAYKDTATRFELQVRNYVDVGARFRLWAQTYGDTATRFKLWVQAHQDTATRFILTILSYRDTATRFKLWVRGYKDVTTRFRLTVRAFTDAATRFRLIVQNYQDIATRFRLWVQAHQDTATRFVLHVLNYQDIATRFRLTVQAHLDVTTLFRLIAGAYTDIVARFGLSIQTHRDTSTRFFLHQPTWEEFKIQQAVAALRVRIEGLKLEPRAHFRI
ncbi:hypothetical protein ES703_31601 [subsurface metagenome]